MRGSQSHKRRKAAFHCPAACLAACDQGARPLHRLGGPGEPKGGSCHPPAGDGCKGVGEGRRRVATMRRRRVAGAAGRAHLRARRHLAQLTSLTARSSCTACFEAQPCWTCPAIGARSHTNQAPDVLSLLCSALCSSPPGPPRTSGWARNTSRAPMDPAILTTRGAPGRALRGSRAWGGEQAMGTASRVLCDPMPPGVWHGDLG